MAKLGGRLSCCEEHFLICSLVLPFVTHTGVLLVISSLLFSALCVLFLVSVLSFFYSFLTAVLLAVFSVRRFSCLSCSYPDLECFQEIFLKP